MWIYVDWMIGMTEEKKNKNIFINKKHTPALIYYPLTILFFELLLKGLDSYTPFFDLALLPITLFSVGFGLLLACIFLYIKPVVLSRILSAITLIALWVIFCVEFDCNIFYNMYYGIVYTATMTGQVMGDFSTVVWTVALQYIWYELAFFIPIPVYFIFITKIIPPKKVKRRRAVFILIPVILLFLGTELFGRFGPYKDVYTYSFTVQNSVAKFGLLNSFRTEILYSIFGTPEDKLQEGQYELWTPDETSETPSEVVTSEVSSEETSEVKVEKPKIYEYNTTVNFSALLADETNPNIRSMHEYFGSLEPTKQNEYTGMFKGKNFVFLTAEAFSPYAIDKDFTPTLYKVANNGFVFENYYQPSWFLSTTGGEFANMTGVIPEWIDNSNSFIVSASKYMPYAPGNMFAKEGYSCYAYHNSSYTYYDRDKTHPNLGYDYKGVGNGLEITLAGWPYSDLEMIDNTMDGIIAESKETGKPFHAYYMTVSGHCNYGWGGNAMSAKHKEEAIAAFPDEPTTIQAYKACNKELDLALESLINKLDKAGILNDTVIVMGADHYPYAMAEGNVDYYKQMSEIDDTTRSISRYKNTLVLYCAEMEEPVIVDTPCSSIDIMPTVCNLFGLEYDSRLYSGRDIFATNYKTEEVSPTMPLVIIPINGSNRFSFVTAAGSYDAISNTFTPNEGITVSDDYVAQTTKMINDKWKYAKLIITNDYYKYTVPKPE